MLDTKKLLPRRSSSARLSADSMKSFIVIKKDLVKIDSLLKERLVLSKLRAGIEKQMLQNQKRKKREEDLERKKEKTKEGNLDLNDDPKKKKGGLLGFVLGGLITGVGALVIAALPMMVQLGKIIGKIAKPIIQVTGSIINMLGSVVTNTFSAFKNLKNNFPLEQIDKIPEVAKAIGIGITALVSGLAAAAVFNTASGLIGAANLKNIVKKIKGDKVERGSSTLARGGGTQLGRKAKVTSNVSPQTLMGRPITTGMPQSLRVAQQIAQEIEVMDYGDFIVSKIDGLNFTRSQFIAGLLQLIEIPGGDSEIMNILADMSPGEISPAAGGNRKFIKNIFDEKIFPQLRGKVFLDRQGIINLNDEIKNLPALNQLGNTGEVQVKEFIRQFANDVFESDRGAFDILGESKVSGDVFPSSISQAARRRSEVDITPDMPQPRGEKIISGTGDDAGAIGRQLLKDKRALSQIDDPTTLASKVLRNKKATKIVSKPILKNFMKTTRQILSPIPLLGDLAILLLDIFVFGEIPARAGFKTIGSIIGSLIGGVVGSLVPGPGTIVGAIIGGIAGDVIGTFVYDMLDIASVAQEAIKVDDTKDLGKSDLIRAGASGAVDFVTVKDLGGIIRKGMLFKNMENKPEFLLEGDLFKAAKDEGFDRDFQIANSLQGRRGFEYLRQKLSYEKKGKSRTRFIPLGGGTQQVAMSRGETITQVVAAPDPSSFFESFNKQILYKRG